MSDRKQIRDQIKAQIETQYGGSVFTERSIDARDSTEFINVFLIDGNIIGEEGLNHLTESSLVIGVQKKGASDDDLDSTGDLVEAAIGQDITLGRLVSGLVYEGFEYGTDESSGFDQLFLKYTIIF